MESTTYGPVHFAIDTYYIAGERTLVTMINQGWVNNYTESRYGDWRHSVDEDDRYHNYSYRTLADGEDFKTVVLDIVANVLTEAQRTAFWHTNSNLLVPA